MYGQNGHSSYSKAVDSAHSSVRVSRVSSTNDGIVKAVGPAYHAPIAAYHGPAAFGSPYHYGGHYAAPAVKVAAPFGHGYPYAGKLFEMFQWNHHHKRENVGFMYTWICDYLCHGACKRWKLIVGCFWAGINCISMNAFLKDFKINLNVFEDWMGLFTTHYNKA